MREADDDDLKMQEKAVQAVKEFAKQVSQYYNSKGLTEGFDSYQRVLVLENGDKDAVLDYISTSKQIDLLERLWFKTMTKLHFDRGDYKLPRVLKQMRAQNADVKAFA